MKLAVQVTAMIEQPAMNNANITELCLLQYLFIHKISSAQNFQAEMYTLIL